MFLTRHKSSMGLIISDRELQMTIKNKQIFALSMSIDRHAQSKENHLGPGKIHGKQSVSPDSRTYYP